MSRLWRHRLKTGSDLLIMALTGLLLTACITTPSPTPAQPLQQPFTSLSATPTIPATSADSLPTPSSVIPSHDSPKPDSPSLTRTATLVPPPDASSGVTPAPDHSPQAESQALALNPLPRLRRLTAGGSYTNPFWSADSRQVQFIDRPASRPVGIYGVDVARPSPPSLITRWIVSTTGGGDFYVYPDGDTTIVQRVATGEKHVISNGGRPVSVSPDSKWSLWQVMGQRGDFDQRRSQTWVANLDGSAARMVAETLGLGQSRWIDEQRILLIGLPLENLSGVAIAALTLGTEESGEQLVQLAQVPPPGGVLVSPEGNWLVYYLTFQSDLGADGLWIVPTDGSQPPHKLDFFGGYRWRDDRHLLYVPMELGVESHTLWEYDVISGENRRLTDPADISFKIANNDWVVSPDGRYIAFVSAVDHNLWLIDLKPF